MKELEIYVIFFKYHRFVFIFATVFQATALPPILNDPYCFQIDPFARVNCEMRPLSELNHKLIAIANYKTLNHSVRL